MKRAAILSAVLTSAACANPDYVVRYDLQQVAYETSERDASPGFDSLPVSTPAETDAPAA